MRKILFNQSYYDSNDIVKSLLYLYELVLSVEGVEKDIIDVISYSYKYYKSEKIFSSVSSILEKFNTFKFIDEKFENEDEYKIYIRDKQVSFRDKARQELTLKYLNNKEDSAERLLILDKIIKLETSLSNKLKELDEIGDYKYNDLYSLRKGIGEGPKTNIEDIDALIGGITAGKIMVVAAPPKCFKTLLALNFMYIGVVEYESENNTLFYSLEIPKDEAYWKLVLRHAYKYKWSVNIRNILKGLLTEEEEKRLYNIAEDFEKSKKHKLYIVENKDLEVESLLTFQQQLIDYIIKYNIKTLILDYIQLMKTHRFKGYRNSDIYLMLNDIVGVLHLISVTYNVRIMLLSQINREGYKKDYKKKDEHKEGKFKLSHLAEISNLERYAYYVVTTYTNDNLKKSNQVKFQLLAHRDGVTLEDPKFTFIIPEYFLIGNNDMYKFDDCIGINDNIDSVVNSSTDDVIDLDLFGD